MDKYDDDDRVRCTCMHYVWGFDRKEQCLPLVAAFDDMARRVCSACRRAGK